MTSWQLRTRTQLRQLKASYDEIIDANTRLRSVEAVQRLVGLLAANS
jgi:hypothetical protein